MPIFRYFSICFFSLLLLNACAGSRPDETEEPVFQHDFKTETVPWTKREFDNDKDKFSFAIFSDLTGGERKDVFAVAMEQLRLLRPEFIIGVGDLVDGVGENHQESVAEWESFDQRAERARAPLFHVGGNHDLSSPDLRDSRK